MGVFVGLFTVQIDDSDLNSQLKHSALCSFLQECSANHAEEMGFGLKTLNEQNKTWMLRAIRIELHYRPHFGEQLTIETWSRGTKGLKALRDFKISLTSGVTIGFASSEWLLVDLGLSKPFRPGVNYPLLSQSIGNYPLNKKMGDFNSDVSLKIFDERKVRFNEIDFNGHVNNARYLSWIEDTLGDHLRDGKTIEAIELHYLNSAKLNDHVQISGTHNPHCEKSINLAGTNCAKQQVIELSRYMDAVSTPLVKACVEWQ